MSRAGNRPLDLAICKHCEGSTHANLISVLCGAQARDLADVVEEVFKEVNHPQLSEADQQVTVLELGVVNSEHFPFNVSEYATTFSDVSSAVFKPEAESSG